MYIEPWLKLSMEKNNILAHAKKILPFSLLSTGRLKYILSALEVTTFDGDTAEIGCAAGGTSRLIAAMNNGRTHWACDTFEGLADTNENDDLKNGTFANSNVTFEKTRGRLHDLINVNVIAGYFPHCAPQEMIRAKYSFVHIDVDTYQSIHNCFDFFVSRMCRGGMIVLDDVVGRGTTGAKKAWEEISQKADVRWHVYSVYDPQVIVRVNG